MPKNKSTKPPVKLRKLPNKTTTKIETIDGKRLRKLNRKQSRKRKAVIVKKQQQKKILPSSWFMFKKSLKQLYSNKLTFLGIIAVYIALYFMFVKGLKFDFKLGDLKDTVSGSINGSFKEIGSGLALFGYLLGTSSVGGSATSELYQMILVVVVSLALIRALRISYNDDTKVKIKDSYYRSTHALIPFFIILTIAILQCLPLAIGAGLFNAVQSSTIIANWAQQLISWIILIAGISWTFRMLTSSIFALYISTLPKAEPIASLRSAKNLVRFRRLLVLRKLLFLPGVLLLASGLVLIPLIIYISQAAEVVFMVFSAVGIAITHAYFYTLYRYLINDKQNDKA